MKFLRIAICALVAFAVLAHGGVEDWARAVLETGAAILFLFWAVRAFFHPQDEIVLSPLLPPLAAFGLLAFTQLIFHRTAIAHVTRLELQLLLAYILLLFLAVQIFRTPEHLRHFMWFIMFFGFLVAIFGILQHLTFNGKLYWFRELRYGGIPFGPYVNRNHFAGFMEMVIPMALVPLALGKVRKDRWFVAGLISMVCIAALFLSASRGGIVSLAAEIGILILLLLLRRKGGKNVFAVAAVLLVAFLLVSWLGVHQILERFSSMQTLEVNAGKRASMRLDTWHIFRDHPWTGTGLGTLRYVFPAYETLYDDKIVNHSHNDYLEALSDTGILGGLCCAWFLGALLLRSLYLLYIVDKSFSFAVHLSGLLAVCAILVHSLVDFNLHIPANALLFFLCAHLATVDIQRQDT